MTIKRHSDALGIPVPQIEDMLAKGCNWEDVFKYATDRAEELKASMKNVDLPKRRKPNNYTKPRDRKKKTKNKRR